MNVLATIRRILWSIILAACITVCSLYLVVSNVLLSGNNLQKITKESSITQTIRDDVLLPRVLESAKSSQYSTLLDEKTVTKAFQDSISTDDLSKKLTPAVDALQEWLNSKRPDVTFSIDTSDLADRFASKLSAAVSAKIKALPACNYTNTTVDAESGVCRSPFVSQTELDETIKRTINNESTAKNATITQDTIQLPREARQAGQDLPTYLNMLYSATVVTAGIGALITLWLLLKHRLAGIVTIGAACVLAGVTLFVATSAVRAVVASLDGDPLIGHLVLSISSLVTDAIRYAGLLLVGGGLVAIVLGVVALVILGRRKKAHDAAHEHKR
jgi:hypothetical protein